jgi:hypothetical protein
MMLVLFVHQRILFSPRVCQKEWSQQPRDVDMIREEYVVSSPLCYVLDDGQRVGLLSVEVLICCFLICLMLLALSNLRTVGTGHSPLVVELLCVCAGILLRCYGPEMFFFAWWFSGGRSCLLVVRDEPRWMINPLMWFLQQRRPLVSELVMQPQDLHSTLRNL